MKPRELFVCDCGSPEHQFILERWDNGSFLIFHMHLRPRSFWRRIIVGLKYVFGVRGYAFEEILLQRPEAIRLRTVIDKFLKETT